MTEKHSSGPVGRFLAALAGYDLDLLPAYGKEDFEHERKKLIRCGGSVLVPALLAFFTAAFFFKPYIDNPAQRLVAALAVSMFILAIDCIIVTTLSRHSVLGTLVRISMSVCLGVVISEPALLFMYQKSITAQIQTELDSTKKTKRDAYNEELRSIANRSAEQSKALADDVRALNEYSPDNIAAVHSQERERQRGEQLAVLNSSRERQAEEPRKRAKELQDALTTLTQQRDSLLGQMQLERDGKRPSGKSGRGKSYRALEADEHLLEERIKQTRADLATVQASIAAILNSGSGGSGSGPTAVGSDIHAAPIEPQRTRLDLLTDAEQAAKSRLEDEIEGLKGSLADLHSSEQSLTAKIRSLDTEYTLAKSDDSLAQARVLGEMLAKNRLLEFKTGALFLLLFLIDTAPLIVKLTVRTGYEDHLKSLVRARVIESELASANFYRSVQATFDEAVEHLCDARNNATRRLEEGCPPGSQSKHIEAIQAKVGKDIERLTAGMLFEARYGRPDDKEPSLWSVLLSTARNLLSILKAKFGFL